MEKQPTPPVLILGLTPGAPVPRARETAMRLVALFSEPAKEAPKVPTERPKLTLIKGGAVDVPVNPSLA